MSASVAKHRAVTAVVGGFVADAASMGLHWIYDAAKLSSLIAAAPDAAFHEPPSCPFYEYTSGAFSPYGDEVYPLLSHVASHGAFHAAEYSRASYEAAKSYTGRLNGVFKQVVAKGDAGETDLATENNDLHGAIKVPVLVAIAVRDGLSPAQLAAVATQATRVHQIGEPPAGAAVAVAVLLHHIVQSSTPISTADAVRALATNELVPEATRALVREVVADVDAKTYADATTAINTYGKSCPLPGSLKGALFVLLTTNSYEDAVRVNIAAGGDNCSRSIVVGACAAAAGGDNAVPVAWQSKTTKYAELTAFAQKLVA